jgi:hypothetical protein
MAGLFFAGLVGERADKSEVLPTAKTALVSGFAVNARTHSEFTYGGF